MRTLVLIKMKAKSGAAAIPHLHPVLGARDFFLAPRDEVRPQHAERQALEVRQRRRVSVDPRRPGHRSVASLARPEQPGAVTISGHEVRGDAVVPDADDRHVGILLLGALGLLAAPALLHCRAEP